MHWQGLWTEAGLPPYHISQGCHTAFSLYCRWHRFYRYWYFSQGRQYRLLQHFLCWHRLSRLYRTSLSHPILRCDCAVKMPPLPKGRGTTKWWRDLIPQINTTKQKAGQTPCFLIFSYNSLPCVRGGGLSERWWRGCKFIQSPYFFSSSLMIFSIAACFCASFLAFRAGAPLRIIFTTTRITMPNVMINGKPCVRITAESARNSP